MASSALDQAAYQKLTGALKRQPGGLTTADMVAKTALPLETVRGLLPRAADEYSGRLEVTESGEIRYSFPHGFTSKYRGFKVRLGKALSGLRRGIRIAASFLFKVWILVMLVGYFALFMLLALGALVLSVAASSSSNRSSSRRGSSGGGLFMASGIFNTVIRIWFYSELLKPVDARYYQGREQKKPKGRPLYKAIFSFVFGDEDPNVRWEEQEKKAVIAYIQANRGVISTPEFAAITGFSFSEAEEKITGYCVEFGGSPEVTEAGTVVYRFDDLLRRADTRDRSFSGLSGPLKRLKAFSSNEKKMNVWFSVINGVNILFGGYFLFNALNLGAAMSNAQVTGFTYFYALVYVVFAQFLRNPLGLITIGLGLVPLVFSVLFWLIPALRGAGVKRDNEEIKLENFRKESYRAIWENPFKVNPAELTAPVAECRPKNLTRAQDQVIKEAGARDQPEVTLDGAGSAVYTFAELDREKRALEAYRAVIDGRAGDLGKTVFDSEG
jgi:hypothetical protein